MVYGEKEGGGFVTTTFEELIWSGMTTNIYESGNTMACSCDGSIERETYRGMVGHLTRKNHNGNIIDNHWSLIFIEGK